MLEGKPISFKMPVLHPGPVYLNFFRFSGPQDYCAIWRERMTFVYLPNLEIFIVIIFQFPVVCIHKSHSHKWLLSQKFSLRGMSWGSPSLTSHSNQGLLPTSANPFVQSLLENLQEGRCLSRPCYYYCTGLLMKNVFLMSRLKLPRHVLRPQVLTVLSSFYKEYTGSTIFVITLKVL